VNLHLRAYLLLMGLFLIPADLARGQEQKEPIHDPAAVARRLIGAVKGGNADQRSDACMLLAQIGPVTADVIPALLGALQDENHHVRQAAAYALGSFGPASKDAVPSLVAALKDRDRFVRRSAAEALGKIRPAAKEAALALGKFGPAAVDAVPDLIGALQDRHPFMRLEAAEALGRIGPAVKAAVQALTEARRQDSDFRMPTAAALALFRLGVPPIDDLKDHEESFPAREIRRSAALKALGEMGPAAKDAVPALVKIIEDRYSRFTEKGTPHVRRVAAWEALQKIDPEAAKQVGPPGPDGW
jgi:HEAT repeat protein